MKIGDYPLPAHAAYIWAVGDRLQVGLPPLPGNEKGHTITLPTDEKGMRLLHEILLARCFSPGRIATKAAPVKYDVEQMLKVMAKKKAAKKPKYREEILDLDILEGL